MRSPFAICYLYILLYICISSQQSEAIIQRIERLHTRQIKAKIGDTVKFQWKYNIDQKNRNETITIFICGYRLKDSSNTKEDPPIIPLAFADLNAAFTDVKSNPVTVKQDVLGLRKSIVIYKDQIKGSNVIVLRNINTILNKVEEFACELEFIVKGVSEKLTGGATKVILKDASNSIVPSCITSNNSPSHVVRGSVFLGAILFDLLIIAVILSASLICNRRSKGYTAVSTKPKVKKRRDIEKGVKKDKNRSKNNKEKKDYKQASKNNTEKKDSKRESNRPNRPPPPSQVQSVPSRNATYPSAGTKSSKSSSDQSKRPSDRERGTGRRSEDGRNKRRSPAQSGQSERSSKRQN